MAPLSDLLLIVPDKADPERDAIAQVWERHGGHVLRLGRFWEPPPVETQRVRLYGPDTFCLVLEQKLELELVSPPDDAILSIPEEFRGRPVSPVRLGEVSDSRFPVFAKPLVPKLFHAAVYSDLDSLRLECRGLPEDAMLLLSPVVQIDCEARSFVLESQVLDCAVYEGSGSLDQARDFAARASAKCPWSPVVMDIAHSAGGWFVLEYNAAWGAGLNGCSAELVCPAIEAATRPRLFPAQEQQNPAST